MADGRKPVDSPANAPAPRANEPEKMYRNEFILPIPIPGVTAALEVQKKRCPKCQHDQYDPIEKYELVFGRCKKCSHEFAAGRPRATLIPKTLPHVATPDGYVTLEKVGEKWEEVKTKHNHTADFRRGVPIQESKDE